MTSRSLTAVSMKLRSTATSRLPLSRGPRPKAISRRCLDVKAFTNSKDLEKAALCIPSPFISSGAARGTCPTDLLESNIEYHGSCFLNDLFPGQNEVGAEGFQLAMERWSSAYTNSGTMSLCLAADAASKEVFLFFVSDLVNTGSFAGADPTQNHSLVTGLYHVHLDRQGHVTDVWLWRSGTQEEKKHLLREVPLSSSAPATPQQPIEAGAAADPSEAIKQLLSAGAGTSSPTWAAEPAYVANLHMHAHTWITEVMSKGNISSLVSVAAPTMSMYDGTGLLFKPMQGVSAVARHLVDQHVCWDLAARQQLAAAVEGNKVFQHWSQDATCRSTGVKVKHHGASLLVFDGQARIQEVVEFVGLNSVQRSQLFKDDAEEVLLRCWAPVGGSAGGQGGPLSAEQVAREAAAKAEAKRAAEEAECLDRQAREWMSW